MALDLDALVLAPCHAAFGEVNRGFPTPAYTTAGGMTFALDGVFRLPSQNILALSDMPGLTSRMPEIDFRLSQFPAGVRPRQNDQVSVRGVLYIVADVRPDGDGLATLMLREAPPQG